MGGLSKVSLLTLAFLAWQGPGWSQGPHAGGGPGRFGGHGGSGRQPGGSMQGPGPGASIPGPAAQGGGFPATKSRAGGPMIVPPGMVAPGANAGFAFRLGSNVGLHALPP